MGIKSLNSPALLVFHAIEQFPGARHNENTFVFMILPALDMNRVWIEISQVDAGAAFRWNVPKHRLDNL